MIHSKTEYQEVRRKIEDILFHAQISKDLENEFKKIQVKDKDLKQYYKGHQEYRTAHILLRIPAKPTKAIIDDAQKKIFEIYVYIKLFVASFVLQNYKDK